MKTIGENMHVWSLEEMIDREIAPKGTSERAAFDAEVDAKVLKIVAKKQRKSEPKVSFHITIPVALRDTIKRNAMELGESANVYVNNILTQSMHAVAL